MSSTLPSNRDERSLEVALTESGVKGATNSRFIAAVDRFFGGFFDRWEQVSQAKAEAKIGLIRIEAEAAARRVAENHPEFGDALILRHLSESNDGAVRQLNRESVVREAYREVIALPPPVKDAAERSADPLNDDWLNILFRHSGDASSDDMRKLWGRVLAGEIVRPGSFSIKTLRYISELTPEVAKNFELECRYRILQGIVLGGDRNKYNYSLNMSFEEFGLISGSETNTIQWVVTSEDGIYMFHCDGYSIVIRTDVSIRELGVRIMRFTKTGSEIVSLMESQGVDDVRMVADKILEQRDDKILCLTIHSRDGDFVSSVPLLVVKGQYEVPVGRLRKEEV